MNRKQDCLQGLNNLKQAAENVSILLNKAKALRSKNPQLELLKLKYENEIMKKSRKATGLTTIIKIVRDQNRIARQEVQEYVRSNLLDEESVDDILEGFSLQMIDSDSDDGAPDFIDELEARTLERQTQQLLGLVQRSEIGSAQYLDALRQFSENRERFSDLVDQYTTQTETGREVRIPVDFAEAPPPPPVFQPPPPMGQIEEPPELTPPTDYQELITESIINET
jgi:hypothetical protein